MTHFPTSTPKQLYPGDQNYYEGDYPLGTCVADLDAWSNVQMAEYSHELNYGLTAKVNDVFDLLESILGE